MPIAGPRALAIIGVLLILAGALVWAFGLDAPLHDLLRFSRDNGWSRPVAWLSDTGSLDGQGPLALLAIMFLLSRRRVRDAAWMFAAIATGRLAVEIIKHLAARPRPPIADRLEHVASASFPSAHSAGTMLTCLCVTLMFGRRWPALAAALFFAALIGWTRLALGVHWPSDVLCGWGVGMTWTGGALALRRRASGP